MVSLFSFAAMYQYPAYTAPVAPVSVVAPENDVNNTTVSQIDHRTVLFAFCVVFSFVGFGVWTHVLLCIVGLCW